MHDRVLCSPDILIDRQPASHAPGAPRLLVVVRVSITQEVPGIVHESIHRISLACSRTSTYRAGSIQKIWLIVQWRLTSWLELDMLGQPDGQLLLRYRNHTIIWTVDDWDRRTPVALAADQPVAQAIGDHELADTPFLQVAGHFGNCIISGRSIERIRVDHYPQVFFGLGPCRRVTGRLTLRANYLADGNAELACKLKVA